MKKDNINIDKLFSSRLESFSPSPPPGAWEDIEGAIAVQNGKKPAFPFFRIAAGLAALISIGSLSAYLILTSPDLDVSEQPLTDNVLIKTNAITSNSEFNDKANSNEDNSISNIQKEIKSKSFPANLLSDKDKNSNTILTDIITYNNESTSEEELTSIHEKPIDIHTLASLDAKLHTRSLENNLKIEETKADLTQLYALLSEFDEIEDDNKKDYAKWAIGGQAGPQYSYRKVSSETATQEYLDLYDDSESGVIAYAGGINIAFKAAKRLSIQSGVYYSKIGQSTPAQVIQQNDMQYHAPINGELSVNSTVSSPELRVSTSMGNVGSPNKVERNVENASDYIKVSNELNEQFENVDQVNQYLEFVEIPIIARYALINRKINFHLLGGVSTNFLIASPVYLDNGNYYSETQDINTVNYSSTVGIGLGYNFSSRLLISIEPQFKYYLNKVNTNEQTNVHPYSYGVFTGVTYSF